MCFCCVLTCQYSQYRYERVLANITHRPVSYRASLLISWNPRVHTVIGHTCSCTHTHMHSHNHSHVYCCVVRLLALQSAGERCSKVVSIAGMNGTEVPNIEPMVGRHRASVYLQCACNVYTYKCTHVLCVCTYSTYICMYVLCVCMNCAYVCTYVCTVCTYVMCVSQ